MNDAYLHEQNLERDAARYRYIRDVLAQMRSPKMNGQHSWHVRSIYGTGQTFDAAIDMTMAERPIQRTP